MEVHEDPAFSRGDKRQGERRKKGRRENKKREMKKKKHMMSRSVFGSSKPKPFDKVSRRINEGARQSWRNRSPACWKK